MADGSSRVRSPQGRLARLGYRQSEASWSHLQRLAGGDDVPDVVVEAFAAAPDPDLAVASLAAIAEAAEDVDLLAKVVADADLRVRLAAVLGTSEALGGFVARHPEVLADVADPALAGPAES